MNAPLSANGLAFTKIGLKVLLAVREGMCPLEWYLSDGMNAVVQSPNGNGGWCHEKGFIGRHA